jgi:hypothetical protein
MRNEFLTSLGALARPSGLARLQEHLAQTGSTLSPEEASQFYTLLQSELTSSPSLESTKVRIGPTGFGGGVYFPRADLVSLDKPALAQMAHELGHVKSVGRAGPLYRSLQDTAKEVSNVTNKMNLVLPLAVAIPLLLRSSAAAKFKSWGPIALDALTGITLAANVPGVLEEATASLDAIKHLPDKMEGTKELIKTLGAYGAHAAVPMAAYQIAKRFL